MSNVLSEALTVKPPRDDLAKRSNPRHNRGVQEERETGSLSPSGRWWHGVAVSKRNDVAAPIDPRYTEVFEPRISPFIKQRMSQNHITALSIALVDEQEVLFIAGHETIRTGVTGHR